MKLSPLTVQIILCLTESFVKDSLSLEVFKDKYSLLVAQSVRHLTRKSEVLDSISGLAT